MTFFPHSTELWALCCAPVCAGEASWNMKWIFEYGFRTAEAFPFLLCTAEKWKCNNTPETTVKKQRRNESNFKFSLSAKSHFNALLWRFFACNLNCWCMTENKTCQPDTRARCYEPRNGAPVDFACWNVHSQERFPKWVGLPPLSVSIGFACIYLSTAITMMHAQQPSSISHKLDMQHRENNVDIIKVHHMDRCNASRECQCRWTFPSNQPQWVTLQIQLCCFLLCTRRSYCRADYITIYCTTLVRRTRDA